MTAEPLEQSGYPPCPCCEEGCMVEVKDKNYLSCHLCGSDAIACPLCGWLNDYDARKGSTVCEDCEYHFCNRCGEEVQEATYYQDTENDRLLYENTPVKCYDCGELG